MTASSSSMGARRTKTHGETNYVGNENSMLCECGSKVVLKISKQDHSFGKKFFTCPNWVIGDREISFVLRRIANDLGQVKKDLQIGNKLLLVFGCDVDLTLLLGRVGCDLDLTLFVGAVDGPV
ncbi:hypothetical protein ACFE04_025895 [Oxalis oulophora]